MRLPLFPSLAIAALLSACAGADRNYTEFISTLEEQPAIIDTISSPAAYAEYLIGLNDIVTDFEKNDVKLTPEGRERIDDLADSIQELLEAKYTELMEHEAAIEPTDSLPTVDFPVNNL